MHSPSEKEESSDRQSLTKSRRLGSVFCCGGGVDCTDSNCYGMYGPYRRLKFRCEDFLLNTYYGSVAGTSVVNTGPSKRSSVTLNGDEEYNSRNATPTVVGTATTLFAKFTQALFAAI